MRRAAMIVLPIAVFAIGVLLAAQFDARERQPPAPANTGPAAPAVVPEREERAQPPIDYERAPRRATGQPIPQRPRVAGVPADARDTPVGAVRAYAEQFVNWDAATLRRQMLRLAALSAGSLHKANRAAGRDRAAVAALRRDGAGNIGHVTGVEVPHGTDTSAGFSVTTRERGYSKSAGGDSRPRRGVYLGHVRKTASGWRVVEFIPRA